MIGWSQKFTKDLQTSKNMPETPRSTDSVVALNTTLNSLRRLVILNGNNALENDFYNTENGVNLLGKIGLSAETRTLVRAAGLLRDIVYAQTKPVRLVEGTVVPTIARVISNTLGIASRKGIDIKVELGVGLAYLESMRDHNDESILEANLSTEFLNDHLNPAISGLEDAKKIIS